MDNLIDVPPASEASVPVMAEPPVSTVLSTDFAPLLARVAALEAQAAVSPPKETAPSSEVEKDLLSIYQRLQNLESHLLDGLGPRVQALQDTLHAFATRATNALPVSIVNELNELKTVVASLGGAQFGHAGHDLGAAFHAWWDKLTGAKTSDFLPKKS